MRRNRSAIQSVRPTCVPLWAVVVPGVVYEPDVAPLMGVNVVDPGACADHCTVGAAQLAGVEAAAVNVAVATMAWFF